MKDFGCKSVYHAERSRDLLRAYFRHVEMSKHVSMPDVFKSVVDMPASRFWVSVARAVIVVASIMHGDKLKSMRPNKREMYLEIHRRVINLRQTHSDWSLPKLVEDVVSQPAPKFYLAPGSARALILKARKKWFAERLRKQRHF